MPHSALAPIEPDVCYPLRIFEEMTGQGRAALATARRKGLPVRKIGNRKYVVGRDWLDHVMQHGETDNPETN